MTQDNDTTDIKLNTTTQMLRKWHLTELPTSSIDLMAEGERIHLSMAFMAGQLNKWTFDEWYNETFNTKEK